MPKVPVQVHSLYPCKQNQTITLVPVHALDLCEHLESEAVLYKQLVPVGIKKKRVGLSQADALTNHIINNTKTNNQ